MKSLNGIDTNDVLLENVSPFRTDFTEMISKGSYLALFPDTIQADTVVISFNTRKHPATTSLIINISDLPQFSDPDQNDTIRIHPNSLFGIRGVDTLGNEHSQLQLSADNKTITFTLYPEFSGRAQFGFYINDGHEKGAFYVYTVDVRDGTDSLLPDKELIINGSYEDGTEVKQWKN